MKTLISFIIVFFSITIFANNPESKTEIKLKKAKCAVENYELCLSHENPGVVESTLANIIKLRFKCPDAKFEPIFEQLKKLTLSGKNEKIRQKAEMVSRILENQELVAKIGTNFYSEVDLFLDAMLLSTQIQDNISVILIN